MHLGVGQIRRQREADEGASGVVGIPRVGLDLVLAVFKYGTAAGLWSWKVPKNMLPADARVEALADTGTCSLKDDRLQVDLDAFTGTVLRLTGGEWPGRTRRIGR